jgi:hypothetical protein
MKNKEQIAYLQNMLVVMLAQLKDVSIAVDGLKDIWTISKGSGNIGLLSIIADLTKIELVDQCIGPMHESLKVYRDHVDRTIVLTYKALKELLRQELKTVDDKLRSVILEEIDRIDVILVDSSDDNDNKFTLN